MPPVQIRLWHVDLDVGGDAEARLRKALTPDEVARAEGFASAQARRRFVVARGTLRALLGELLGERPRSVAIETGASGKPRLAGAAPELGFNISHSGDLALICIAEGAEAGVDLEGLRPVPDAVEIARRRFAPAEARFVEEGGQADVDRRFLLCWTRKEALAKALGAGLSFGLRSFAVPLAQSRGVVSLGLDGSSEQRWQILDVPMGAGHVAALALPAAEDDVEEAAPTTVLRQPFSTRGGLSPIATGGGLRGEPAGKMLSSLPTRPLPSRKGWIVSN